MTAKRRVLLYGKSLILSTVAASLRTQRHLELVTLAPPFPAERELVALEPDVILFDLDAARPEAALAVLQARPHLLLIGIDAASDQMVLWSGQRSHAVSMEDLVQAIGAPDRDSSARVSGPSLAERLKRLRFPRTAWVPTRKQKLAFVLATVTLAICLVMVLSPVQLPGNEALAGTAVGESQVQIGLAFTAGIILGGLVLGLWPLLRRGRR